MSHSRRRLLPSAILLATALVAAPTLAAISQTGAVTGVETGAEPAKKPSKKPHPPHPSHPAKPSTPAKPAPKPSPRPSPPPPPCTGDPRVVQRVEIPGTDPVAWGRVAYPTRPPRGLVVFAHGYGHTAYSWDTHLARTAAQLGVVAVAMDYRGQVDVPPTVTMPRWRSRGWRVAEGADDSVVIARHFDGLCPTLGPIAMYGVGMGANAAGLAVAARATRRSGAPLFTWLVDVEGVADVRATYREARLLASTGDDHAIAVRDDIEAAMGGTIERQPELYRSRSLVERVADLAAARLRGVVVVHAADDGRVLYLQSRDFADRLRDARVPVDVYTVLTHGSDSESGVTLESHLTGPDASVESPLAGHGDEMSGTHLVIRTGFERLAALFAGVTPTCVEAVVDGTAASAARQPVLAATAC